MQTICCSKFPKAANCDPGYYHMNLFFLMLKCCMISQGSAGVIFKSCSIHYFQSFLLIYSHAARFI